MTQNYYEDLFNFVSTIPVDGFVLLTTSLRFTYYIVI